jgi:hypothetical protein
MPGNNISTNSIVFNVSSISIYSIIAICAIGQYIVVPALKGSTVDASAIFQCLHNAGQCRQYLHRVSIILNMCPVCTGST